MKNNDETTRVAFKSNVPKYQLQNIKKHCQLGFSAFHQNMGSDTHFLCTSVNRQHNEKYLLFTID